MVYHEERKRREVCFFFSGAGLSHLHLAVLLRCVRRTGVGVTCAGAGGRKGGRKQETWSYLEGWARFQDGPAAPCLPRRSS